MENIQALNFRGYNGIIREFSAELSSFQGSSHSSPESCQIAEVGSPSAETRPIFAAQRRHPHPTHGHVYGPCTLVGLHLVLHREERTRQTSRQLDCRSVETATA